MIENCSKTFWVRMGCKSCVFATDDTVTLSVLAELWYVPPVSAILPNATLRLF